uniref:Putative reverse transcriptase domain-containing protein n=1 Tax=Tanacetum cinerariifolium TaxID=118510 RepID=A0A6L2M0T0_TANCI|nr:putative reverse transcriptase domain-containing protein [Tanacetum cinerariifolium]
MSMKAEEPKLEDIAIVRNFSVKHKKYVWGDEQEVAFQTLKDKSCNAHVLALPDGPKDFVVYCNASCQGLGSIGIELPRPGSGTYIASGRISFEEFRVFGKAPAGVFETGESSYVTHLECLEEQIDAILDHLDEIPLERIEKVEENIKGLVDGRVRQHADMKSVLDKICELKNHKGGPPGY